MTTKDGGDAKAAVAAGADMLGVLDIETGLELRKHSIDLPAFAWLHSPQSDFAAAIDAGIDSLAAEIIDRFGKLP